MKIEREKYFKFRATCILAGIFSGCGLVFSQSPFKFIWPIDSPFVITGNYGELRPNHFHAGIDFSTNGAINLPVYSIEEGYVSRIRIGPYGYGKCIYITHPGGRVSVYGHLNLFSLKILNVAKKFQYDTQNNEIDYVLTPRTVYVRKNEIIGLSGNTGGSTGPHLHFEIRDELTEVPLNPLGFYRTNDRTPPEVHALAFYDLSDSLRPAFMTLRKIRDGRNNNLVLNEDHIVLDQSIVGLAFSGLDRFKPNGNPNNIYTARIYVEDKLIYSHALNNISFEDSRFINEFSEEIGKSKFQKCFVPAAYPEGFFGSCVDQGRLLLNDTGFKKVKVVVADEAGNSKTLQFFLKAKKVNAFKEQNTHPEGLVMCREDVTIKTTDTYLYVPAKTLFYSAILHIENKLEEQGTIRIFPEVSLRQPVTLGFKLTGRYWQHSEKLVLKGASVLMPLRRNDSVFFALKEFGKYRLSVDTIPPRIRVDYSERRLKEAWLMDSFSFHITDGFSGIGKYNLWLNNTWVIADYDSKTDLLTYYFDEDTPIGLLQFKLEVEDKSGNKTYLEYTLRK